MMLRGPGGLSQWSASEDALLREHLASGGDIAAAAKNWAIYRRRRAFQLKLFMPLPKVGDQKRSIELLPDPEALLSSGDRFELTPLGIGFPAEVRVVAHRTGGLINLLARGTIAQNGCTLRAWDITRHFIDLRLDAFIISDQDVRRATWSTLCLSMEIARPRNCASVSAE